MSGRPAILKVDIVTDADTRGIDQAESRMSRFGSKAGKVGKMAAIGLAGVGVAAVGIGVKLWEMGDAADDANASLIQGAKTMGVFGKESDKVAGRLIKYAEATARQTGLDTNSIKATQAKLLTFGELAKTADKAGGNFDRATQAAIDMAAKGFGTAEGNAVQLGKALNDPIKGIAALAKSGVTFTEAEKERISTLVASNRMGTAQRMVLKSIETQVGGTAKAMAGGFDRMKVTATQFGERLGMKLVPMVDKASNWLLDKLLPAARKLGAQLADKLGPTIAAVGGFITDKLVPAGKRFYEWFVDKIVPGLVKSVQPRIEGLRDAFGSVAAAVERNEPQLRKIGRALAAVAEFIANKVMPVLGLLIKYGFKAVGVAIGVVIDAIGWLVDKLDFAIGKIQDLVGWIGKIDVPDINLPDRPGWLGGAAGGMSLMVPTLDGGSPSFDGRRSWSTAAAGGGLAAALRTVRQLPAAGAAIIDARTTLSVTVDGSGMVDEAKVARELAQLLARWAARMGRPITELLAAPGVMA